MSIFIRHFLLLIYFFNFNIYSQNFDLTIIGSMDFAGSLARISIGLIELLKDDLNINFINTIEFNKINISKNVKKVINQNNLIPGKVTLFTDVLWLKSPKYHYLYKKIPKSEINIAYSMLESTAIPQIWVKILNQHFDAVVVPDIFFKKVYKNSGVKIPIFVLSLGVYLQDFLNKPEKKLPNKPFVFGCSAVGWERKNLGLLVQSFVKAFKNNNSIILKIHSKQERGISELKKFIVTNKIQNIKLINSQLSWKEYINLFSTFDCYVLLSKGEGFSITPREALALGIPCIISNNTAHKTICNTGYVYSVPSKIIEPAYYDVFGQICGNQFNCKMSDVIIALKDVYKNYEYYLNKAKKGRIWVEQYLFKNLKNKYLNLIKPKKIKFGNENIITDDYLMTNSRKLYKKYMSVIGTENDN